MLYTMNSNKPWRAVGLIIFTLVFAAGLLAYTNKTPSPETNLRREVVQTGAVSLTIEGVYANKSVPISENETALELLQKLHATDRELKLQTREYSGLGTLVIGMRGWENGTGGKYWQYKINSVMPQVGAGAYKLKSGDVVEWYFGPSLF